MESVTVTTGINIAIVKYWGKRCEKLNLPLNSSLSVTLNQKHLKTTTSANFVASSDEDELFVNSIKENIRKNPRVMACLQAVRDTAASKDVRSLTIKSFNNFPTAAGVASSASGYAALATSLVNLYGIQDQINLSSLARRGSGSASRSIFGGFVEWQAGCQGDGSDSIALQVFNENHWPELCVFIVVVSATKKKVSSSEGMRRSVATSSFLRSRTDHLVGKHMEALKSAIEKRDFDTFAHYTMVESNQLHAVCADTLPPIYYLNETSHAIIDFVHAFNQAAGSTQLAYTFDAGPNAFLFTLKSFAPQVASTLKHHFGPTAPESSFFRGIIYEKSEVLDVDSKRLPDAASFVICTDVGCGPVVTTS